MFNVSFTDDANLNKFQMKLMKAYFREIGFLKSYMILLTVLVVLSYSVYLFFNEERISDLGDEDHFFEWMTAISFLLASMIFLIVYFRTGNLSFLILTVVFFVGFGEEISWGQRIMHFRTPEPIEKLNVQSEVTLHNLKFFNTTGFSGSAKHGLSRLFEINFLFKLFTIAFGILLPLLAYHVSYVSKLTQRFMVPVPPVSLGIFFLVNWLFFRSLLDFALPKGHVFQYYDTDTEIFEFVSAFIIMVLSVYFYFTRNIAAAGKDIKQVLIYENVSESRQEKQTGWITSMPSFPWTGSFPLVRRSKRSDKKEVIRKKIKL